MLKKINGYEIYYVSNDGKIYSDYYGDLREMKPFLDGRKRYYSIGISKNKVVTKYLVHRIVAEYFVPKEEEGKNEVNHKDYNSHNNNAENLEWCDRKENMAHAFLKTSPKRNCVKRKLIFPEGKEIIFNDFMEVKKFVLREKLNCSPSSLNIYHKSRGFKLENI